MFAVLLNARIVQIRFRQQKSASEWFRGAFSITTGEVGFEPIVSRYNQRGLTDEIIRTAQPGYIPGRPNEWMEMDGIKVPRGITIPWYADGAIWGIKV